MKTRQIFPVLFALILTSSFSFLISNQIKPVQAETLIIKHSVTVIWAFDNASVQNWFCTKVGGGNETILESTHHYSGSYAINGTQASDGAGAGGNANEAFGLGTWNNVCAPYIPQTIWTFPANIISANLTYWGMINYNVYDNSKAVGMKLAYANNTYIWDDLNTGLAKQYGVWVQSEVWNLTSHLDFDVPTQIKIKIGIVSNFGSPSWWSVSYYHFYDSITLKYDYNEITVVNVLLEQIQGLLPIFLGIGIAGFVIVLTRRRQG